MLNIWLVFCFLLCRKHARHPSKTLTKELSHIVRTFAVNDECNEKNKTMNSQTSSHRPRKEVTRTSLPQGIFSTLFPNYLPHWLLLYFCEDAECCDGTPYFRSLQHKILEYNAISLRHQEITYDFQDMVVCSKSGRDFRVCWIELWGLPW